MPVDMTHAVTGEWLLRPSDVEALAVGAQVLGTGGGGSASAAKLRLLSEMNAARTRGCCCARISGLGSVAADAVVIDVGGMGAPTVSAEKLDAHEVSDCQVYSDQSNSL